MSEYVSLLHALEGYFEAELDELPEVLRERVQREIRPCAWDHLSPKQRRSWAWQTDYQNDLAAEEDGDFWFNFCCRKDELRKQIREWASIPALTAGELTAKERRLGRPATRVCSLGTTGKGIPREPLPQKRV